jgi:FMN reductase
MSDLVVLVGNPRAGSRTSTLAAALAEGLVAELAERGVTVTGTCVLEVSALVGVSFTDRAIAPSAPQVDAIDVIRQARVLVVATPSYKGTYTGLLKVFLDQLPHQALAGVAAVPVAIAGSPVHAVATAADQRRLLLELGADAPAVVEVLEAKLDDIDAIVRQSARTVIDEVAGYLTPEATTVDVV